MKYQISKIKKSIATFIPSLKGLGIGKVESSRSGKYLIFASPFVALQERSRDISFLILIFALCISMGTVKAAEVTIEPLSDTSPKGDFVVGPGKLEISLNPGETKTVELTIVNRLGTAKIFTISKEDIKGSTDPDKTVVLLGDDRGPYSLRDYLKPAVSSIKIESGYRARVPVTLSLPANAEPGGLYGSLVVGLASSASAGESSSGASATNALVTRIGTLFFVRVNGVANEKGHLDNFRLSSGKKYIFDSGKLNFDLLFKNEGNISLNPYGSVTIANSLGTTVGLVNVEPWYALPQSLRYRKVEWQPTFLFGRYVATALISPGYGSDKNEINLVFWVIPWKVLLMVVVILILIVFILRRWRRGRRKGLGVRD